MIQVKITLPVTPVPKGRPKTTIRYGRAVIYTPEKTLKFEKLVRHHLVAQGVKVIKNPVKMNVKFHMPIPKSWTKKKKNLAICGKLKHTTTPDIDNLEKAVMDAMNGFVYSDDKLVFSKYSEKLYSENPRIELDVEEVRPAAV